MFERRFSIINEDERLHEEVMHAVAIRMKGTKYVPKGGTALAFACDLDRNSADIDLDATEPAYISGRIRRGLHDAGVEMSAYIVAR